MGKGVDPWPEGQQAWGRLAGWSQESGHPASGDDALTALTDIGVLRRLLDQVEFKAVRTARKQGKPWSEIAIRLGVTRQSAWERLRDVDEAVAAPPTEQAERLDAMLDSEAERAARQALSGITTPEAPRLPMTRDFRRRSSVLVPNVIGMSWADAHTALRRIGLVAAAPDPDGPPVGPQAVVTDQSPESGATVPPGSSVTLWVDRGGGSGVREPRRPKPDPKAGQKMWDEVTDEAANRAAQQFPRPTARALNAEVDSGTQLRRHAS